MFLEKRKIQIEKTMDPIHIHHLLRQLSNEVKCPHCGAKVQPNMVSIESSSQNFCLLKIACHSCGEEFHGHAHVGVKVLSDADASESG